MQPDAAHEVGAGDRIGIGVKPLVTHGLNRNVRAADRAVLAERIVNPLRQLAMSEVGRFGWPAMPLTANLNGLAAQLGQTAQR